MNWLGFFICGWGLLFTLYAIAQICALLVLRGLSRTFALVPMLPMAWVVYVTAEAWSQQSNLWPIVMIFASPIALAYVLLILVGALMIRRRRNMHLGESVGK